jgi:hypothetical protein
LPVRMHGTEEWPLAEIISIKEEFGTTGYYVHYVDCKFKVYFDKDPECNTIFPQSTNDSMSGYLRKISILEKFNFLAKMDSQPDRTPRECPHPKDLFPPLVQPAPFITTHQIFK